MLDQVEAFFSLKDRFTKWLRTKNEMPFESVAGRFLRLFESHGVHRNQIPRFLGHGLSLSDIQDESALLAKLDEPILNLVCEKFAIRREWLDGAERQIYLTHDFYKHPEQFFSFLQSLQINNPSADLRGALIAPTVMKGNAPALLILQETIGAVGEKAIYRFHICDGWIFSYWKARAYLTACVAIAWKSEAYIYGFDAASKEIENLATGEYLLGWNGEGIWGLQRGKRWYPEDMALQPDIFLRDVDPERKNFGIKSALSLWLTLHEQGYMNLDVEENANELFKEKLSKHIP